MQRRRILLLFAGFLAALLLCTFLVLRHTGASKALVEGLLARFIRSRFDLAGAEVDPASGRVRLTRLQVAHPVEGRGPMLSADNVEVDVNTNPLSSEAVGSVRQVKIDKLDLRLDLSDDSDWDWREVLQLPDAGSGPETYPAVVITDSRFSLRLDRDSPEVVFTEVELELVPEAPGDTRMVLQGSMSSPAGFAVKLSGTSDFSKGEFRALLETSEVSLDAAAAAPYSAEIEAYLREAAFSGTAKRVAVWLQYPPEPGDASAVTARLGAELEEVSGTAPQVPYPLRNAKGKIQATTRDGGRVQFDLGTGGSDFALRVRGELRDCFAGAFALDLAVEASGVPVDEVLAGALVNIPEAQRAWSAFAPSGGHVDADLFLTKAAASRGLDVQMDLTLRDVNGSFVGFEEPDGAKSLQFPYAMSRMNGLIQLRPGRVVLDNLTGSRGDGGRMRLHGELDRLQSPSIDQEIALDIQGHGLAFSDELRGAVEALLPGDGAEIYDRFAPRGRSDCDVRIRKSPGEPDARVYVVLRPLDCSVAYEGFPYRLDAIRGAIELQPGAVTFGLSGNRGSTAVDIGGRYLLADAGSDASGSEHGLESELWVEGKGVALDQELRQALAVLSPDLDRYWEVFDPRGAVDCKVSVWRRAGAANFEHDLRLEFLDGSIAVRRFDKRVEQLGGTVFVHGDGQDSRLDISVLRGRVAGGSAQVLLEGTILAGDAGDDLDLTAVVRGLELNDDLAQALDRGEVLDRPAWQALRPSGAVDLITRFRKDAGADDIAQTVRVQLRGVRSDASFLPAPATALTGEVLVSGGSGRFEDLRARIGDAEVMFTAGAFGVQDGRTFIEATLSSDHLPIDASFANLMTGPLRQTFLDRHINGALRIERLHMRYELPEQGDDFALTFDGEVYANDCRMLLAAPVHAINGRLAVMRGRVTPAGGTIVGAANGVSFEVLGHRCQNLNATVTTTPERIAFSSLSVLLHGGTIDGNSSDSQDLVYSLADGVLSAKLRWDGIRLSDFMRAAGQPTTTTRGTVSGDLDLTELRGTDLVDVSARGTLAIRNGRLGEVPMFSAIYSYLAPKNRPQFDGLSTTLEVKDRAVQVKDLVVTAPQLQVVGKGVVTLDGYVDIVLEFPNLFASAADWLILPRVLNVITSQVVRFHVFGYMRAPQARPRWLFQDDPERLPIAPIPSELPPSPRRRY